MATLTQAHKQWANRPDDECYTDIDSLLAAVVASREQSAECVRPLSYLRPKPTEDGDIVLVGSGWTKAKLTNWSFGQLCRIADTPASFLPKLSAPLAVDILTEQLARRDQNQEMNILGATAQHDGIVDVTIRAFNTDVYSRLWDADLVRRVKHLQDRFGWNPAPPAYNGRRGLYASDHDIWIFMVDNDRRIFESAPGGGLSRGFFLWNSEVGDKSVGWMEFLYNYICGNHMIWGASQVKEFRSKHVGEISQRLDRELGGFVRAFTEASAAPDEAKIRRAMDLSLGRTKEEVLEAVFTMKRRPPVLTMKKIEGAYEMAEHHEQWYGSPRSAWGMASGLTELSQNTPYADARNEIDRAAKRLLEMAF